MGQTDSGIKEQLNYKNSDQISTTTKDNYNLKIINLQPDDDLKLALPLLLPNNVKPSRKYLLSLKNKFLSQPSNQKKEPDHFLENTNSLLSLNDLLKENYDQNQKDIFRTVGTTETNSKKNVEQKVPNESVHSHHNIRK